MGIAGWFIEHLPFNSHPADMEEIIEQEESETVDSAGTVRGTVVTAGTVNGRPKKSVRTYAICKGCGNKFETHTLNAGRCRVCHWDRHINRGVLLGAGGLGLCYLAWVVLPYVFAGLIGWGILWLITHDDGGGYKTGGDRS